MRNGCITESPTADASLLSKWIESLNLEAWRSSGKLCGIAGSAVILPVVPDGRLVFVRQYRYAVDDFYVGIARRPYRSGRVSRRNGSPRVGGRDRVLPSPVGETPRVLSGALGSPMS